MEGGTKATTEEGPFNKFEPLVDLLTDRSHDSVFAEQEGLVDLFVEYREYMLLADIGTELADLKKNVKEYQDALVARLHALPAKNTS